MFGAYSYSDDGDEAFQLILEARKLIRTRSYVAAIEKLQGSITLAEEAGQKFIAAIAHNNIAEIYRLHRNFSQALYYYRRAIEIYREIGNQNGLATTQRQIDDFLLQPVESGDILAREREKRIHDAIEQIRDRVRARENRKEPHDTGEPESAAYLNRVKKAIVGSWKYPEEASRIIEEVKVEVSFIILQDGRLKKLGILKSAGNSAMDREAIRAVMAAAPFPSIPEQLGRKQINVEFTFNYLPEKTQLESKEKN